MNSFRLRLALLLGSVTAALLLGVGAFAWQLAARFNLDRLDRELRNLAKSNLERVNDGSHWARVDEALGFVSGPGHPPSYVLWVANDGVEEYRSPRWPRGIAPEKFPVPQTYSGGRTLAKIPPPPRRVQISADNPALPSKDPYFFNRQADGSTWRIGVLGNPYTTLVLAANIDEYDADLVTLRSRFLEALAVALLIVGGGAWVLASRALRPVTTLTRAAEGITERGLDQRIAAPAHDREFQRLVTVFNAMLDRLEKGFHQARRFSADASHELKTPLALLQAEIEQALNAATAGSPEQRVYTSLLDEIHHLKAILEKLLLLSLADSGRLLIQRATVDLSQIVANVAEDCAALAPGLKLEASIPQGIRAEADAVLLEQAFQNLTNNAVKYNRDGGCIRVVLKADETNATLSVGNSGPGIAPGDRDRVFERFYRGDPARSRLRGTGVGLGLSLSREILRAHEGELSLSGSESDWTEFTATLPRVSYLPPSANASAPGLGAAAVLRAFRRR